ncbi:hypothetical protein ET445_01265 [Agromyces protaetiae]|uniref:Amine oxidase domain-containing protein n=1 Tax=Agromyces protaetiae TaxID=2509455 RepID=A0A4P6FCT9_9MICO|nr:NAD(P)/FAD-dependent oxidoreductase [Agromyces protaetiae]QAY72169.1 hypothetical protein ET445_01265 [Agromyces protaetiae]
MDSQGAAEGIPRRGFLAAALAGVATVVLASCTAEPAPTPTPTRTPTPSPTPTPTPTPLPPGIPEPTAFRRTRWSADPYARGAFSFDQVGTTPELRETLATPVDDRIWFAGEACSTDAPGTVQGAFESGARAASEIMRVAQRGERIAIVGAGVAGLAAARALSRSSRDLEVVVVEARDRVGGRIHSVDDGAFERTIELGSPFVDRDGALDGLLDDAGVETTPVAPPTEARVAPTHEWVGVQSTGDEALAVASTWAHEAPYDTSLASALAQTGADALSTEPQADGVSPADWLEWSLRTSIVPATAAEPERLSAKRLDLGRIQRGRQLARTPLAGLVDELAASADIALSNVVRRIARVGDRVSLRFETGESLRVDRVVVTAPLGVLKTDTIEFEPRLPRAHQRAISVLGMGAVDLVWLRFDEAFWRSDAPADGDLPRDVLTVVGPVEAPPVVADPSDGAGDEASDDATGDAPDADEPAPALDRLVNAWIDVGLADDEPVLVGIVAGERAGRLEALSDDESLAAVLEDLRPFLPAESPVEPPPLEDSPQGEPPVH